MDKSFILLLKTTYLLANQYFPSPLALAIVAVTVPERDLVLVAKALSIFFFKVQKHAIMIPVHISPKTELRDCNILLGIHIESATNPSVRYREKL